MALLYIVYAIQFVRLVSSETHYPIVDICFSDTSLTNYIKRRRLYAENCRREMSACMSFSVDWEILALSSLSSSVIRLTFR